MTATESWQRFSQPATTAILYAQEEARRQGTNIVDTEHLLLGLLRDTHSGVTQILGRQDISYSRMQAKIDQQVEKRAPDSGRLVLSPRAKTTLEDALANAREGASERQLVETEHILLGLICTDDSENHAVSLLKQCNVDIERLRNDAIAILKERA